MSSRGLQILKVHAFLTAMKHGMIGNTNYSDDQNL